MSLARVSGDSRSLARLGLYERFEQGVALALTFLVSCAIVVAIADLVLTVGPRRFPRYFRHDHDGTDCDGVQPYDFEHPSPQAKYRSAADRNPHFIIGDVTTVEPLMIIGLAFAVLALGSVYWLVRDQDRRQSAETTATQ